MPTFGLLSLILGLLAVGAGALLLVKWRSLRRFERLSEQLRGIVSERTTATRVDGRSDEPGIASTAAAINQLLSKLDAGGQKLRERDLLFQRLVEAVHEAVLLHRDTIVYANSRFAALTGLPPRELVGMQLHELVPDDYKDIVRENVRRRLAREPDPDRFDIELLGPQGQVSRLATASSIVDMQGDTTLLTTAVEMLPRRLATGLEQERSRALATLQSIGEGVITTDKRGHIDYMNEAAETLTGAAG